MNELSALARTEGVTKNFLEKGIANGRIIALKGKRRTFGIGYGLTTKTNANLGFSPDYANQKSEFAKLDAAVQAGADTVMDLSIGVTQKDLDSILSRLIKRSPAPVGTVPTYRAFSKKRIEAISEDDLFNAVERHARLGASFQTIHAAITRKGAALARKRVLNVVSRGGCLLASWMQAHEKENPFYKRFDYLLETLRGSGVAISLGDALRPGALADANDAAQLLELRIQGELVKKARKARVPVFCEGPGHMRLDQIEENIRLQKRLCHNAPYYVLGPLVTDVGAGWDHVGAAIGGAIAAASGADFLCVVTPSEHLALPSAEDVREGVIATRLAAHAGDLVKLKRERKRDYEMSKARALLDWRKQFALALDSKKAHDYRQRAPSKSGACSMCGDYCAIKKMRELRG